MVSYNTRFLVTGLLQALTTVAGGIAGKIVKNVTSKYTYYIPNTSVGINAISTGVGAGLLLVSPMLSGTASFYLNSFASGMLAESLAEFGNLVNVNAQMTPPPQKMLYAQTANEPAPAQPQPAQAGLPSGLTALYG